MAFVIAQLSDIHIGGPSRGSGERFSQAIDEINAMTRRPDLVLLTGDLTHNATREEWDELQERLGCLTVPWEAIPGNHDRGIEEIAGHRAIDAGPLRLVLVDTSADEFGPDDASWLDRELSARPEQPTVIAVHHPPFETGIWWMDCVGLGGSERFEEVVRRHPHAIKVLSGHVHRPIQTAWGGCSLWVGPSTSVTVAADLDPGHDPAESAEPPMFSLHAYTGQGIISHLVPVGPVAARSPIEQHAPDFVRWARDVQAGRPSLFTGS
jgi:3',5'-cyclic AMP phosphodiesterase CpdA